MSNNETNHTEMMLSEILLKPSSQTINDRFQASTEDDNITCKQSCSGQCVGLV